MRNRFTYESKTGRNRIPPKVRTEVCRRDGGRCQYCGLPVGDDEFTIDHLVPLALGGLDEITNYVTACRACNERKSALPLSSFAAQINIRIETLPVHGDPIIDNERLPIQIRLVRKRIFDAGRRGDIALTGKGGQKRIEKEFRRAFWETHEGRCLESEFPLLPGHVRIMIPEIQTIAKDEREYLLLIELAKSANTRNLIGDIITGEADVLALVRRLAGSSKDPALTDRIKQALARFESAIRRRGIAQAPGGTDSPTSQ